MAAGSCLPPYTLLLRKNGSRQQKVCGEMGVKKAAGGRPASALLLTVALAVQMAGGAAYPALAEDAVPGTASPSGGYQAYLDTYKDGAMAGTEITLPAASYTAAEMEGLRVETDYKGKEGPSLMTAGTRICRLRLYGGKGRLLSYRPELLPAGRNHRRRYPYHPFGRCAAL